MDRTAAGSVTHIVWPETEHHYVGYLPALALELVARDEPELLKRATSYGRLLLNRMGLPRDLHLWVRLARRCRVDIGRAEFHVDRPTTLEAAKRSESEDEDRKKTELERSATDLLKLKLEPAYEIDATLNRIAEALNSAHARPLLLVGPSGVGKTAAIRELVRQRRGSRWMIGRSGKPTARGRSRA